MSHSILIVEDNAVMAHLLQFNLTRAGFEVTIACNGNSGFEKAVADRFDVVVTDHQLPGMLGTDLCKSLREMAQYRSTPIILCTAKGLELDRANVVKECGLTEVLFKPVSPRKLVSAINDLLATASV
jgi:DNA-binding response OmpR family regulator